VGFVKTAAEVERIEAALASPRFGGAQMLSVEFLADPDFVAAVLPPPLEPLAEPRMRAMVGRWQSNCVGDFAGGTVYVACAHDGVEGEYNVAQYMDGDAPTIFGRDLFGEPKKMAAATLRTRGSSMRGTIVRHGVPLIELEAELDHDNGPFEATRESYNVKSRPAADGRGLEEDAILTRAHYEIAGRVSLEGQGRIAFRGTVHDPLHELPIRELLRATYFEGDLAATVTVAARIPAAIFAPTTTAATTIGARWRARWAGRGDRKRDGEAKGRGPGEGRPKGRGPGGGRQGTRPSRTARAGCGRARGPGPWGVWRDRGGRVTGEGRNRHRRGTS
jgi:acetoacetate decarboxylase